MSTTLSEARVLWVIDLTRDQRATFYKATSLVMAESCRGYRAQATQLICSDYLAGHTHERRGTTASPDATRTPIHLRLWPDQYEEIQDALAEAKQHTGAEDDAAALTEIMLEFLAQVDYRDYANDPDAAREFSQTRAAQVARLRTARSSAPAGSRKGRGLPATAPAEAVGGRSTAGTPRPWDDPTETDRRSQRPRTPGSRLRPSVLVPRRRGYYQPATAPSGTWTGHSGPNDGPGPGVERGTFAEGSNPLGSMEAFTKALGFAEDELRQFLKDVASWYRKGSTKKGRSHRVHYAPHQRLRKIQRRIKAVVERVVAKSPLACRTPEQTVDLHAGARWFVRADTCNFHPSVASVHVASALGSLGAEQSVRDLLIGLSTLDDHLVQGAPTSAVLAPLVTLAVEVEVFEEAQKRGVRMSRWGDDVGVSGDDREAIIEIAELYVSRMARLGLRVRRTDAMPPSLQRRFLKHNLGETPSLRRNYRRKIERRVQRALREGVTERERRRLEGKIGRMMHFHTKRAVQLKTMLRQAALRVECEVA